MSKTYIINIDLGEDYPDDGDDRYRTVILTKEKFNTIEVRHDELHHSRSLTEETLQKLLNIPVLLLDEEIRELIQQLEDDLENDDFREFEDAPISPPPTTGRLYYGMYAIDVEPGTTLGEAWNSIKDRWCLTEEIRNSVSFRNGHNPVSHDWVFSAGDRIEGHRRMQAKGM